MPRLWHWLRILILAALGLLLLYVAFALVFMDFMVDLWWFDSLGYLGYFIQLLTYRYVILVAFSLLFFLVFFLNFWVASRFLGATAPPPGKPWPCPATGFSCTSSAPAPSWSTPPSAWSWP